MTVRATLNSTSRAIVMEEQGSVKKPKVKAPTRRPGRSIRKAKGGAKKQARRSVADPAMKRVEKLGEIVAGLRRGQGFSITRLTVLKGLYKDRRAAGEFALFLARKAQGKLKLTARRSLS